MRPSGFARAVFTSEKPGREGSLQRRVRSEDQQAIKSAAKKVTGESTLTKRIRRFAGKRA
jgi:hypothetical protein